MGRISEAMLAGQYPSAPGFKEPTTSRLAAQNIATDAKIIRARVLAAIKERPRTADEVADAIGIDKGNVRPRCSELRADKLIRPMLYADGRQERRQNKDGNSQIVWESTGEEETK